MRFLSWPLLVEGVESLNRKSVAGSDLWVYDTYGHCLAYDTYGHCHLKGFMTHMDIVLHAAVWVYDAYGHCLAYDTYGHCHLKGFMTHMDIVLHAAVWVYDAYGHCLACCGTGVAWLMLREDWAALEDNWPHDDVLRYPV